MGTARPPIRMKVAGNSMLPLVREGSELSAFLCAAEEIYPGDIAVAKTVTGEYLCHRVMRKLTLEGNQYFLTKGDNRFRCDPSLHKERFIGKVRYLNFGSHKINIDSRRGRLIGLFISFIAPIFLRTFIRWRG